ncbi:conserved Plasmodium protein, unknown function [Plasmodium chabaudi chabaudi]|uniref:Uncharacterized protein n=1 Tax=Plasmodium chabaudi chabaudi TaxID=31271 RepID=A0A1C6XB35_PLACU|nr:conserved Plasmodium protein, unknown function [Plasmodium chabaudi chabaudi]
MVKKSQSYVLLTSMKRKMTNTFRRNIININMCKLVGIQNHKLTWMNEEEFLNFEKLMPRLDSYFSLYLEKAKKVKEQNMLMEEEFRKTFHE